MGHLRKTSFLSSPLPPEIRVSNKFRTESITGSVHPPQGGEESGPYTTVCTLTSELKSDSVLIGLDAY